MNLTRRGPRFTFQKRVPSDLAGRFGASSIRLPLPPCGAREAQRLAALLGGQLEVRFMEARLVSEPEDEDPRDALIRDLTEQLEQLRELYRTKVGAAELALKEAERRQEAAGQRIAVLDDRLHQLYERVLCRNNDAIAPPPRGSHPMNRTIARYGNRKAILLNVKQL